MYSRLPNSILLLVDELVHEFFLFFSPVPIIASLEIDPVSMAAFSASFDANFPLKTPLNIQAIDAIGEVITDGPDSILVRRQYSLTKQHSLLCVHFFFGYSLPLSPPSSYSPPPLFSQQVTVEANPSSACISNDSSFQLVHGEAVFPGSICAPINDVQLRFSVVSDGGVTLNTQWTSNFTVTGTVVITT